MTRWLCASLAAAWLIAASLNPSYSGDKKKDPPKNRIAHTSEKEAGPDFQIQGEYVGKHDGMTIAAQVIAKGDGKFVIYGLKGGLPGDGWEGQEKLKLDGVTEDGKVTFKNKDISGTIKDGKIMVQKGDDTATLERVVRKSPTLGAKPPEGAVVLFDGKSADEWQGGKLVEGDLLNNGIRSKKKFKDYTMHIEFRLPFMPYAGGQDRANSGVYMQDRYEIQVLDSFGLKGQDNECGGIYSQFAPKVNMCFPPLSWQTYDIDFTAARFENGKRVKPAVITVRHNGVVIHENQDIKGETGGGQPETDTPGPFQLQDHGNPVYFRNIWVAEKK